MGASGFQPLAASTAKVLVLGTLPGEESLRRGEYYAHPRNAFWRIVEAVFGISAHLPYVERVHELNRRGVALWDVCATAKRRGSLDTAIRAVVPNDFASFLKLHPELELICFNGAKAGELFRKHVKLESPVPCCDLPSTSPANAAISFAEKVRRWSSIREVCEQSGR